jgi:hypothetical protein
MAKITQMPEVQVTATFAVDEEEMRALDAMVGYGFEAFLSAFQKHMGTHYMHGHEDGLKRFFESTRANVAPILRRADDARAVFTGQKIATIPPKDTA